MCGNKLKEENNDVNKKDNIPCESFGDTKVPKRWIAFLICLFLGILGIHRFYSGKVVTGILWMLTASFLGIGYIVDLVMIVTGNFKDSNGIVYK